eukprot:3293201-Amphidinium_carterae.1
MGTCIASGGGWPPRQVVAHCIACFRCPTWCFKQYVSSPKLCVRAVWDSVLRSGTFYIRSISSAHAVPRCNGAICAHVCWDNKGWLLGLHMGSRIQSCSRIA